MATTKEDVVRHISPSRLATPAGDCPVLGAEAAAELKECVKTANAFSMSVLDWLQGRTPEQQAAWLKATTEAGRVLFQPWATEILYVIAVTGRARFSELQDLLGVSSRTLSDKLKMLKVEGFVDREVYDEQPVRIEYTLTKRGRMTAALATPLLAQLNARAQGERADLSG